MKNTKLFVGISLMVQSVAFLVLALVFWGKKKSLAKAFAAVSAAGGVAGAFCLGRRGQGAFQVRLRLLRRLLRVRRRVL